LDAADKRFAVWEDSDEEQDQNGPVDEKNEPETKIHINDRHQLVVTTSGSEGKVVGHRALKVFYKQRPHLQNANYQLITSLVQEHKRLASLHHQEKTNKDTTYIQNQNKIHLQVGIAGNKQKHYRNQNPM
jgi:hypothetical protein